MSQQRTTTSNIFRVEDVTFRGARKQSEIDKELGIEPDVSTDEVEVPVSLTPEQIKSFYLKKIQATQDQAQRRVYAQTIKWIDELQSVKAELMQYKMKELREQASADTPDDIQE